MRRLIDMRMETNNLDQKESYIPHGLLLQWHVTERCNLRCAHCYQSTYSGQELQFQDLLRVLGQFKDLLNLWRRQPGQHPVRGHITVTGGEPFVRRSQSDGGG